MAFLRVYSNLDMEHIRNASSIRPIIGIFNLAETLRREEA